MTVSRLRSLTVLTGLLALLWLPAEAASAPPPTPVADDRAWVWPLDPVPTLVRGFSPPAHRWEPGHRGVDLLGSTAQPVLAIGAGDITFARPLAGRGVVVVGHGGLRSTYEPVTASVRVGQHVGAGEVIGLLQTTRSHCPPEACLHLGLRRGDVYLDPLSLLGARRVRLKPVAPTGPGSAISPVAAPPASTESGSAPRKGSEPAGDDRVPAAVGAAVAVAAGVVIAAALGFGHARG